MLVAAVTGCTLTDDEFTPLDVSMPRATASESEPAASQSVAAAAPSTEQSCADAEDISACRISACLAGACAELCENGVLDGDETDVDCGGACAPCALQQACRAAGDCGEASCTAGVCVSTTCQDGAQNGSEVAVDCGGECPPCAAGQVCASDADCQSPLFCAPGSDVCTTPTCEDGLQNGAEGGVDCGGGTCAGCADGAACVEAIDCASGSCRDGRCAAPGCDDGVRNGDERGVDCGGVCAEGCDPGTPCEEAGDCTSGVCDATGCDGGADSCCQSPTCEDGVRNGSEPVIDCGDEACGLCATGRECTDDAQCATGFCGASESCEVPVTCDDELQNGNEGDVDCGGSDPTCPRCDTGQGCRVDADCEEGSCVDGACASCDDGILNGGEERVDCGGDSGCPACPRCFEENSIDLQGRGVFSTVPANSCVKITGFVNGAPPAFFDSPAGQYPIGFTWRQECSGTSETNAFDAPFQQRLFNGTSASCALIIDLAGSAAPAQLRWF